MSGDASWRPPAIGYLKFNADGAWDENSRKAGVGVCCRDETGMVILVEARWMEGTLSSEEAEEWAIGRAMEIAEEKGISKAIFELDCAQCSIPYCRDSQEEPS
ncbi:hypothetical protein QQ045_020754 [Rhodiola kirilowii]